MLPFENDSVSAQRVGPAAVAHVRLSKISDLQVSGLRSDLEKIALASGGRLIIDLTDVLLVTSAAIGMFIQVRAACESAGGRLALIGVSETILQTLRITRLDKVLCVRPTLPEALGALG